MKTLVPDYYQKFSCLASACRHTCCIGWEIDIDEDTEKRYLSISRDQNDPLSEKMARSVKFSTRRERRKGIPGHFLLLGEEERCPFLTEDGLCEIILQKGERALCQICTDHPRFRNRFPDHIEMGLGLTCEEACRIVLSEERPAVYAFLSAGEKEDTEEGTPEFLKCILPEEIRRIPDGEIDWADWADIFLSLERLDNGWTLYLQNLKDHADCPHYVGFETPEWKNVLERLKEYLLYRHFMDYGHDFCELIWNLILRIAETEAFLKGNLGFADFSEIVRLYSGEIEYSDENRELIMNELEY